MKEMNFEELFGAIVNFGSDPYIVETEEQAEEISEAINNASSWREINDDEEFETATRQLELEGHDPERIFSFVDGSELLVCFPGDWY